MSEPATAFLPEEEEQSSPPIPPRPGFGFLLGGTTLGILFGCVLLCAGAEPAYVILITLSICGAITGGLLESLWPKPIRYPKKSSHMKRTEHAKGQIRKDRSTASRSTQRSHSNHECQRCGEVFEPSPVICPMCGHSDKNRRSS